MLQGKSLVPRIAKDYQVKSQEGGDMQAAIREHYSQTAIQSAIGPGAILAPRVEFCHCRPEPSLCHRPEILHALKSPDPQRCG